MNAIRNKILGGSIIALIICLAPFDLRAQSEMNITDEREEVRASTEFPSSDDRFRADRAVDGNRGTSWFSQGSNGEGQDFSTFEWIGAQDFLVTRIKILSNAQHNVPNFRTGFGFDSVQIQLQDENGNPIFQQTVVLVGTPDPDVEVSPGFVGRKVFLKFVGHESAECGGFSELEVHGQEFPIIRIEPPETVPLTAPAGLTSSPQAVTIRNAGQADLVISEISTGAPFDVNLGTFSSGGSLPITIPPGSSEFFQVRFTATDVVGIPINGDVTIASNDPIDPVVTVPLRGDGTDPIVGSGECARVENIVSWWPGEDSAGDIVDGNGGTLQNGAGFDVGLVGQAFRFDGDNDIVEVPNNPNLNPNPQTGFTVEAWAKPNAEGGTGTVVGKGHPFMEEYVIDQFRGRWRGLIRNVALDSITIEGPLFDVNRLGYTHLALTWDGQTVSFYVDGQFQGSKPSATINSSDVFLGIGGRSELNFSDDNLNFSGLIDEVSYYGRALSEDEILAIVASGSFGKCAPSGGDCVPGVVSSDFEDAAAGVNGWTIVGNGSSTTADYVSSGGNPGGYIKDRETSSSTIWFFKAPPKFLGNKSCFYGGRLTFDTRPAEQSDDEDVVLRGGGITLMIDYTPNAEPPGTRWTSYSVDLLETAGWRKTNLSGPPPTREEMVAVLSSLTEMLIGEEYIEDGEDFLDNVFLRPPGGEPDDCITAPDGLVSWWDADRVSETTATDLGDGGNSGMLENVGAGNGKVGQAFSFNSSTNSVIRIPHNDNLNPTTDGITVEAWVMLSTLNPRDNNIANIVEKNFDAGVLPYALGFTGPGGHPSGAFGDNTFWFAAIKGAPQVALASRFPPEVGVWYHLAGTIQGSNLNFYVNGQRASPTLNQVGQPITAVSEVTIGTGIEANTGNLISRFDGLIDEVSIYDRALTAGDILAIFEADSRGKCKSGGPAQRPIIRIDPPTVPFTTPVGETSIPQTVTIINDGTADLIVSVISGPGAPFDVNLGILSTGGSLPVTIPPNGSESFQARFSPTSVGIVNGSIAIRSNDLNDPTVTVPLRGEGIDGGAGLNPPRNLRAVAAGNSVVLGWDPPIREGTNLAARVSAPNRWIISQKLSREHRLTDHVRPHNEETPVDVIVVQVGEIEPNDSPAEAQVLTGDSPLVVTGQAEVEDEGAIFLADIADDLEDVFRVTTTAPGLQLELSGFQSDCDLYLFDAATALIAESNLIGATTPEDIFEPGLPPGTYTIGVTIYDPDPIGPPTTPYVLTATGQFGTSVPATILSYNIYRSDSPDARRTGVRVDDVDGNTVTFTDPELPAQTYFYQVTAMYDIGESGPSNEASATISTSQGTVPILLSGPVQEFAGNEFWIDIRVGDSEKPVSNLFGVSFVVNFTQTTFIDVVRPTSSHVIPGAFLGNDLVFVQEVDEEEGKVSVGVSRKAGQGGVNGSGTIVRIKFVSNSNTPDPTQVNFSISELTANDPGGNSISMQAIPFSIVIESGMIVWPGDTNNGGVVNQADVLPIGLCWSQTGPVRPAASVNWSGQVATPWTNNACTYADANGDGVVNQADVLPVGLNWGQTHTTVAAVVKKSSTDAAQNPDSAPTLSIAVTEDTDPGKEFWIEVHATDAINLFGLSFELTYSPTTQLEPLSAEEGSWLGNDLIFISNFDTENGKISIGVTRKAGQGGVDGSGITARVKMKMSTSTAIGDQTQLSLQNVNANDPDGQALNFRIMTLTLITDVAESNNRTLPPEFTLEQNYPNPFNPETRISYALPEATIVRMEIYNLLGQKVRTLVDEPQPAGLYSVVWDGRSDSGSVLASGTYLYHLKTERFESMRKLLLLR